MGTLVPPGKYNSTYASFGPPKSTTQNGKPIGSAVFAQLMTVSWGTLAPPVMLFDWQNMFPVN